MYNKLVLKSSVLLSTLVIMGSATTPVVLAAKDSKAPSSVVTKDVKATNFEHSKYKVESVYTGENVGNIAESPIKFVKADKENTKKVESFVLTMDTDNLFTSSDSDDAERTLEFSLKGMTLVEDSVNIKLFDGEKELAKNQPKVTVAKDKISITIKNGNNGGSFNAIFDVKDVKVPTKEVEFDKDSPLIELTTKGKDKKDLKQIASLIQFVESEDSAIITKAETLNNTEMINVLNENYLALEAAPEMVKVTANHKEKGSNKVLLISHSGEVEKGTDVTMNAENIKGYHVVGESSKTIKAGEGELDFFYEKDKVDPVKPDEPDKPAKPDEVKPDKPVKPDETVKPSNNNNNTNNNTNKNNTNNTNKNNTTKKEEKKQKHMKYSVGENFSIKLDGQYEGGKVTNIKSEYVYVIDGQDEYYFNLDLISGTSKKILVMNESEARTKGFTRNKEDSNTQITEISNVEKGEYIVTVAKTQANGDKYDLEDIKVTVGDVSGLTKDGKSTANGGDVQTNVETNKNAGFIALGALALTSLTGFALFKRFKK